MVWLNRASNCNNLYCNIVPLVASILFVLAHKWLKIDNFWNFFFFQNWKTQLSKNIWIYVIAFAPIVIQTQQAPQNDHRNLSFVKGNIVNGNRMTRKGPKMTISKGCLFNFRTDFTYWGGPGSTCFVIYYSVNEWW